MFGISKKKIIENYEKQISKKNERIKSVLYDKRKVDLELLEKETECLNYKNNIERLRKEIETLKKENRELNAKNATKIMEINELKQEIDKLEAENNELLKKTRCTALVKHQLKNMCLYRDKKGNIVKNDNEEVLVNDSVDGVKVWNLARLLY